jgi:hypothetical protein
MRRLAVVLPFALILVAACSRFTGSAPGGKRIAVGKSATGTLTDQDPVMRGDRGPYNVWTLRGKRGQRVVIDLTSSAFDPYLVVRDADGFLIGSDDDSGGRLAARLRTILSRSGEYRIIATSVGATARGDYTLTVSEWVAPAAPRAGVAQTIATGETRDGILEPGDELTGDGPYQDRWSFELREGERAHVEMRSTDLDAYLIVLGPDGRVIATNDDAMGRDAGVTVRAASAGRYTALATTYGDQPRVGAYRVGLKAVTGEFSEPGATTPIAAGETKTGQLESGDSATAGGAFADVYQFRAPRTGVATINLTSSDLDPYLTLQDSTGSTLATDDDSGEGMNAMLAHPVQAGAMYRIVVGTYGSGPRTGAYQLAIALR